MNVEVVNISDINKNWKDAFLAALKENIPIITVNDTSSPPLIENEIRHFIHKKYLASKR